MDGEVRSGDVRFVGLTEKFLRMTDEFVRALDKFDGRGGEVCRGDRGRAKIACAPIFTKAPFSK